MSPEATLPMTSLANCPPESRERLNMAPPRLVGRTEEMRETALLNIAVLD